jgi:SET domain-containing protein
VNVTVRPTQDKGRGVFAVRRIRPGEIIETAPVLLVPKGDAEKLAETFLSHYMFKSDNKKHLVIGLGLASMINHSADANAEFFVSSDRITIKALRAIPNGSEVTFDYKWTKDEWAEVGVEFPPPS